jgi:hypothetical protein
VPAAASVSVFGVFLGALVRSGSCPTCTGPVSIFANTYWTADGPRSRHPERREGSVPRCLEPWQAT